MPRTKKFFKNYWITILLIIVFIWFYVYITKNDVFSTMLFPEIDEIIKAFYSDRHLMLKNLIASLKLVLPSLLISFFIALFLGTIMGLNTRLRNALNPIIYAFSCIPSILLSPFVILLAPNFWWASVIMICYDAIWPTLFATINGIRTINTVYNDVARTLEVKGFKKFLRITLPAASPSIFSGFVNSLRSSFVVLVFAEMYGATAGLGFYVKRYSILSLYANMWAGFLFMVFVLVIIMVSFENLKDRMLYWTID